MSSIIIKMIVSREYKFPNGFDKEDFELFQDKLNVLTAKADKSKLDAIGSFLHADKLSGEEPEESDFDSVKFLGVINND